MVHLGPTLDPESASSSPNGDINGWSLDELEVFGAALIDRKVADTPEEETTLFLNAAADVAPGELFVINTFSDCESEHVGLLATPFFRRMPPDTAEGKERDA